jgi:acyl-CoA hydrolase
MKLSSAVAPTSLVELDLRRWIRPGDFLVWGQGSAEPFGLTALLRDQSQGLGPITAFVGMGFAPTFEKGVPPNLKLQSYCATAVNRALVESGRIAIWPGPYADLPRYLASRTDVLLLSVSPPDATGAMSLGLAHEYLVPLIDRARVVIGEINAAVPFAFGARTLRPEECDALVIGEGRLPALVGKPPSEVERRIAAHVGALVEDGSVLQIGIGSLPDAILAALKDRRDLGLHSGLASEGCMALTEAGALTNARKRADVGVSIAGMAAGSPRFYRFLHRNSSFSFRSTEETHDVARLAAHDRFVAINSALEVDLTGQINSESIAGRYLGAVGGGGDFLRGAARSRGGLPIVVMPSTSRQGDRTKSRIVARLDGPVSTARADAGLIVTEHGVADLRGLTLPERRDRMLSIAAPEFQRALEAYARVLPLT